MPLTRSNYEEFAACIYAAKLDCEDDGIALAAVESLQRKMAEIFERDNPLFNPIMWEAACNGR
jgi:hypothetical protein